MFFFLSFWIVPPILLTIPFVNFNIWKRERFQHTTDQMLKVTFVLLFNFFGHTNFHEQLFDFSPSLAVIIILHVNFLFERWERGKVSRVKFFEVFLQKLFKLICDIFSILDRCWQAVFIHEKTGYFFKAVVVVVKESYLFLQVFRLNVVVWFYFLFFKELSLYLQEKVHVDHINFIKSNFYLCIDIHVV